MALVFISHDLAAVARATQTIAVMYGGDVVERGPTAQVLSTPRHPYTIGLLGARPGLGDRGRGADGRRRRLVTIPGNVPPLFDLPVGCRFSGRCSQEIAQCAATRPVSYALDGGQEASCHLLESAAPGRAGAGT